MLVKRIFQTAGAWGLIVLTLGYTSFLTGADPSLLGLARPEFVHGFFLVCLPWQLVFFVIASDPPSYRPIIAVAILEKLPFAGIVFHLYGTGQVNETMLFLGLADATFGLLFCWSFFKTGPANPT